MPMVLVSDKLLSGIRENQGNLQRLHRPHPIPKGGSNGLISGFRLECRQFWDRGGLQGALPRR